MSSADPIICRPYNPPAAHLEFGPYGSPTWVLVDGRRPSESFIPVPAVVKGRRKVEQEAFDPDGERRESNSLINEIRRQVALQRHRNYPGATAISRKLLLHLAEVADRHGKPDFRTRIDPQNAT